MQRKMRLIGISAGLTLCLSGSVSAQTVITFEEDQIATNGLGFVKIFDGFFGFDWEYFFNSRDRPWLAYTAAGIATSFTSVSGNEAGFQAGVGASLAAVATHLGRIKRATPFQFVSAFFHPAWHDNIDIRITGYLGNSQVEQLVLQDLSAAGPRTLQTFGWTVDELRFSVGNFTGAAYTPSAFVDAGKNPTTFFVMDDFTVSGLFAAMFGALVVGITSTIASWYIGPKGQVEIYVVRKD